MSRVMFKRSDPGRQCSGHLRRLTVIGRSPVSHHTMATSLTRCGTGPRRARDANSGSSSMMAYASCSLMGTASILCGRFVSGVPMTFSGGDSMVGTWLMYPLSLHHPMSPRRHESSLLILEADVVDSGVGAVTDRSELPSTNSRVECSRRSPKCHGP